MRKQWILSAPYAPGFEASVVCTCGFTVNSGMCVRLRRQFFITEVTPNRILDWISILRRKGQGGSKCFTEINILFVR